MGQASDAGVWWQLLQNQLCEEVICESWCLGYEGYYRVEGWGVDTL